jgi:hypothetical protein
MSDKSWKRARRGHDKAVEKILLVRRIARRCPRVLVLLAACGMEKPLRHWTEKWEGRTRSQIERMLKRGTHRLMERRAMRAGPQPLPGHMSQKAHEEIRQEVGG